MKFTFAKYLKNMFITVFVQLYVVIDSLCVFCIHVLFVRSTY